MAVNSNATTPCFPLQPSSDEAAAAAAARANTAAAAAEDATEDASKAASDANDAKNAADAAVEAVNAKLALVQTLEEIYGGAYVNEQVSGSTINITDGADSVPVKALSVAISGASPALTAVTINKTVNGLNTPYTMSLVSGGTQLSVTEGTLDFVNGVLVSGGVTYDIDDGGIDVPTSLGANTFTTSAGVMDMTYRADIDLYLQETYLALANLENAVVGNAKQLVATVGINDNAPYLFRTSGGTADIGDRETDELVGGTVAWNQLISTSKITVSEGTYVWANSSQYFNGIANHRYLMTCDNPELVIRMRNQNEGYVSPNGQNIIVSPSFTSTTNFVQYNGTSTKDSHINVHDLTLAFGSTIADHAYSLETATAGAGIAWLRKHGFFNKPYYPHNAGGLLSVKTSAHKMIGFNAWDEEWENGYFSQSGELYPSDYYIRSKNFIRICAGCAYRLTRPAATLMVCTYDGQKSFLERITISSSTQVKTFDDNVAYIKFACGGSATPVSTYKNDICINLSWDGERDGEYAPYVEYTYPLDDDIELRGIPKLDANNNLYYDGDVYESDGKVTRRYGIVDLGTLAWAYDSDGARFWTALNGIMTGKVYTNMVCQKYVTASQLGTPSDDKMISQNKAGSVSTGVLLVKDSSYTDAATFKTAMSGVMLVYELATPTTETADTYINPQIVDDFGTEEYVDEREVPIPAGHNTIYSANLRAKLEMAPDSPDGDGDYIVRQTNGTNEYVPLPVSNIYQHNAVITLASNAGTVYLPYVSKLATAYNIVDIGSTDGAPTTTPIYPATGYYDSKAVVAIQFGLAPAITVYLADGTNASTTMTALADTVG